jgi:chromate reductase
MASTRIKFLFTLMCMSSILSAGELSAEPKVLAFSGSSRGNSYNQMLMNAANKMAKEMGAKVTVIDLKDYPMPFYDADLETNEGMPEKAKLFRNLIAEHDALIIACPEYNRSIPAVLKNALDWASRNDQGQPERNVFNGKKVAIMSTSPGQGGGKRALAHLRDILIELKADVVGPQVYAPNAPVAFDSKGELNNPTIKKELEQEVKKLF